MTGRLALTIDADFTYDGDDAEVFCGRVPTTPALDALAADGIPEAVWSRSPTTSGRS